MNNKKTRVLSTNKMSDDGQWKKYYEYYREFIKQLNGACHLLGDG